MNKQTNTSIFRRVTSAGVLCIAFLGFVAFLAGCGRCEPATYTLTTTDGKSYTGTARGGAFQKRIVELNVNGQMIYVPTEMVVGIVSN